MRDQQKWQSAAKEKPEISQYLPESTKTGDVSSQRTLSGSLTSICAVVLAFTANKQTNKQTNTLWNIYIHTLWSCHSSVCGCMYVVCVCTVVYYSVRIYCHVQSMAAGYVYMVLWMYNDDFPFSMCWLAGWPKDAFHFESVWHTFLGRPCNAYIYVPMVAHTYI